MLWVSLSVRSMKKVCIAVALIFLVILTSFAAFAEEGSGMQHIPVQDDEMIVPSETGETGTDWFENRQLLLRKYLTEYGGIDDPAVLEKKVSSMSVDPDKPMIALTFDDGPVLGVTDRILDLLEKYNVRATFFICGWRLKTEGAPELLKRMVALGCELANHTYNHTRVKNADQAFVWKTIRVNNNVIRRIVPDYPILSFRPPSGGTSLSVRMAAKRNGMSVVLWSQSGNVHAEDAESIYANVLKQEVDGRQLQDGDIVLLHDTKERMVEAMELLIPDLLRQGYQLVTVQELLHYGGQGMEPGVQYYSSKEFKYAGNE